MVGADFFQTSSNSCVPRALFSVDECSRPERYELWKASIAAIFDVEADAEIIENFHASLDAHLVGPLMLARTSSRRQNWYRSSRTLARDGLDHYLIQFFEHGSEICDISGKAQEVRTGDIIVYDLSRPLANSTTDFRNLTFLMPRELLAPHLDDPDGVHNLAVDAADPLAGLLRDHMRALKDTAHRLTHAQAADLAQVSVGLLAACLNGRVAGLREEAPAVTLALLARIKRDIEDRLDDPRLTPDHIARRHGISRTRLYALFDAEGGVAAHLRRRRLRRAFQVLCDRRQHHRTLYDIALDAGYQNDAAFCRAFKAQYDITPGELRRFKQMQPHGSCDQRSDTLDRRYESWLRDLTPTHTPDLLP